MTNKLNLDPQQPQIAVSLTGESIEVIKQHLALIKIAQPDIVEWRVDSLMHLPNDKEIELVAKMIETAVPDLPVIATFRTFNEGGNFKITEDEYFQLLKQLNHQAFEVVDVELHHDDEQVATAIQAAHQHQQQVIASYHHFQKTPAQHELIKTFKAMQTAGADIAKIAVMPNDQADVLTLMNASLNASQQIKIPIVSMSMGDLGIITRVSGKLTNSVITFASLDAKTSSAPGQIPVDRMRTILNTI